MTKIEWCEETWNPITGCTPISEGCENCYARRMAKRLAGRYGYPKDDPFKPVTFHHDKIDLPLRWKKPRMIFAVSMGDLFHEAVDTSMIIHIAQIMREAKRHIFQVLTKRPERLFEMQYGIGGGWPLWESLEAPNIWIGVTAENQKRADERIPILLQIPAAVHFVSLEPMLSDIDIRHHLDPVGQKAKWEHMTRMAIREEWPELEKEKIDWIIVGSESGPRARPCDLDWIRNIRDQCVEANVPLFVKQARIKVVGQFGFYFPEISFWLLGFRFDMGG